MDKCECATAKGQPCPYSCNPKLSNPKRCGKHQGDYPVYSAETSRALSASNGSRSSTRSTVKQLTFDHPAFDKSCGKFKTREDCTKYVGCDWSDHCFKSRAYKTRDKEMFATNQLLQVGAELKTKRKQLN